MNGVQYLVKKPGATVDELRKRDELFTPAGKGNCDVFLLELVTSRGQWKFDKLFPLDVVKINGSDG